MQQQLSVLQGSLHRLVRLAVAVVRHAGHGFPFPQGRFSHPGHILRNAPGTVEHGMILSLGHQQPVLFQILADHKPAAAVSPAADSQSAALAEGIVHQAVMTSDHFSIRRNHISGLCRQVFRQELFEIPFPDKAHTCGILLFTDRKAAVRGDLPHLFLGHAAHRENSFLQLLRMDHIKEITLVLVRIGSLQQLSRLIRAHKVPGRHTGRPQRHGKVQKSLKLDFPVAQHVRIGGTSCPVFLQEIGKNPIPVFFGEIDAVIRNTDQVADIPHIPPVFLRGAGAVDILFLPVFHENAHNVITLLLQKQGRNRGIHASAHADYDAFAHFSFSIRRVSTFSCISAAISSREPDASTTTKRSGSRAIS